jgi:pimeloyl-ACP methyl ester carboxylesterase
MSVSPALGEQRQALTSAGPIRYRESGEGEAIVLFHEWSTNADTWRKVVPELSGRYRLIAADWPYGTHEVPMVPEADLSSPGLARIVVEFLDELGLDQATFVGNGGGSTVASITAAWHPGRAGRLLLGTGDAFEHFPAPKLRPYARLGSFAPTAWAFTQVRRARWAQQRYYDRVSKRGVAPEAMASYCEPLARSRLARRDVRRALRGIRCEYSIEAAERLRSFRGPAIVAWAREDRVFPFSDGEKLARMIPNARLEPVDDCYTYIAEDRPELLTQLIDELMAQPAAEARAA